jgi:acyl carrier protein
MELNDFIKVFADQFDDTDISEITPSCKFHDLDEWSSLIGMSIIAFVRTKYGKAISSAEIKSCETINDLFELIKSK